MFLVWCFLQHDDINWNKRYCGLTPVNGQRFTDTCFFPKRNSDLFRSATCIILFRKIGASVEDLGRACYLTQSPFCQSILFTDGTFESASAFMLQLLEMQIYDNEKDHPVIWKLI